jgi:hypothetical protein
MKNLAKELLEAAQEEARRVTTWADLSNYLFAQDSGIVSKAFTNRADRKAFMQTPEYQAIQQLISDVRARTGLIEGATPKNKPFIAVSMPPALHAALEAEAQREGVSLNQLVVAKLSMQMSHLVPGS